MMRMLAFLLLSLMPMQAAAGEFILTSGEVAEGVIVPEEQVYDGGSCHGGNTSPSLAWQHAPAGTKSFAVTMHDPDASRPGGWWHWLIFNIPADVSALAKGSGRPGHGPAGSVQGLNSFGTTGYGGPCPPMGHGVHHYVFTVYALDTERLPLTAAAEPAHVDAQLRRHALGLARLTAVYQR
jgi:Raf kinase inhibitor-like YbhB/YbcL family protein